MVKGFSQIKQLAEAHFQKLYRESNSDYNSNFLSNIPNLVSKEENEELMQPFLEQEIIDVIWSMEPDNAPSPYGFSFHFYRICWTVIRKEILIMIK